MEYSRILYVLVVLLRTSQYLIFRVRMLSKFDVPERKSTLIHDAQFCAYLNCDGSRICACIRKICIRLAWLKTLEVKKVFYTLSRKRNFLESGRQFHRDA